MDDKTLRQSVIEELDWEPSVDSAQIAVTVHNGIVTLGGHVPTYAQKIAAANVVRRVRGVKGVAQEIEVVFGATVDSDESIAQRAVNLLNWNVTIPRDAVKVQVSQGYVTLSGQVDWDFQRSAAEIEIRKLAGVAGVTNSISLKPRADGGDIKLRIEKALERSAEIEAKGIKVSVVDGRVVLDGKVRAWYERDVAERAAWGAPGVRAVEDHVTVGP